MSNFRPLLSAKADRADLGRLTYPLLASPKLDGIRAVVLDGQLVSRTLKPIPNDFIRNALSRPCLDGLDGELIVGSPTDADIYLKTNSAVMSKSGDPAFTYYVFDIHNMPSTFAARLAELPEQVGVDARIVVLEHKEIKSEAELIAYQEWCIEQGYEGVMLRRPSASYKYGRSTLKEQTLVKLKVFEDGEAKVLGMTEEMHNANEATTNALGHTERSSHKENKVGKGRMGTLVVRDLDTNVEFEIGTGFTAAHRQEFWEQTTSVVGRIVKYKHFPHGAKDKPRHPVFLGFRDPIDMGEPA
jgi:DNA ligase-1